MLPIKYQSTWKVCCRIIEIIRREMIILSSSSRRRKKKGNRFSYEGVSSHTTTCPLESWNTFTTSSNFFSIYLRAFFHLSFLSLQTQHPEPHVSRACFNPERKRERERVEGVRFHWGWLVERDESVDRNGLMAWKSRPTDAFRRGPDRWAPSRFWREPWPFTILGWKFERDRNGFDSILIFSKYRMKSIHFLHFLS